MAIAPSPIPDSGLSAKFLSRSSIWRVLVRLYIDNLDHMIFKGFTYPESILNIDDLSRTKQSLYVEDERSPSSINLISSHLHEVWLQIACIFRRKRGISNRISIAGQFYNVGLHSLYHSQRILQLGRSPNMAFSFAQEALFLFRKSQEGSGLNQALKDGK